jgi:hypothetical protein
MVAFCPDLDAWGGIQAPGCLGEGTNEKYRPLSVQLDQGTDCQTYALSPFAP